MSLPQSSERSLFSFLFFLQLKSGVSILRLHDTSLVCGSLLERDEVRLSDATFWFLSDMSAGLKPVSCGRASDWVGQLVNCSDYMLLVKKKRIGPRR